MKKFLGILIILGLLGVPAWASMPGAGDAAPGFSLVSVDGKAISLEALQGKVVLIGMFHICVPCMNQAMEFNKVRAALPSGQLAVLGINTSGDSKKAVMEYLSQFPQKIKFPYLLDPELKVHKAYTQRDMPTVLIIDAKGVIRARTPAVGADQLIPYLKDLL